MRFLHGNVCARKRPRALMLKKSIDKELLRNSIERIKKLMFGSINKGINEIQGHSCRMWDQLFRL